MQIDGIYFVRRLPNKFRRRRCCKSGRFWRRSKLLSGGFGYESEYLAIQGVEVRRFRERDNVAGSIGFNNAALCL